MIVFDVFIEPCSFDKVSDDFWSVTHEGTAETAGQTAENFTLWRLCLCLFLITVSNKNCVRPSNDTSIISRVTGKKILWHLLCWQNLGLRNLHILFTFSNLPYIFFLFFNILIYCEDLFSHSLSSFWSWRALSFSFQHRTFYVP